MKTFVAGHRGMVGSALVRALRARGETEILCAGRDELDLRDAAAVRKYLETHRPETVYLAAAKVGGIQANIDAPATFLYDNLVIQCNVLEAAARFGVKQTCFLASSCIYPRLCPQPMKEESLLTGPLEPTNEGYALAKIAGIRLAQYLARETSMRAVVPIPCNLYGPGDSFHPEKSHVLSALVRKFVDAAEGGQKSVSVWGTGKARRELLHVDDLADAVLLLMDQWHTSDIVNVGSGDDVSIAELARLVAEAAGFRGEIVFDPSRPDGMPRKCLDVSRLTELGFKPKIDLPTGIRQMIDQFKASRSST